MHKLHTHTRTSYTCTHAHMHTHARLLTHVHKHSYSRLGPQLTEVGESFYNEYIPPVLEHLQQTGAAPG